MIECYKFKKRVIKYYKKEKGLLILYFKKWNN